jgi:predicted DNA-binding protein YlxM (UPF0122 family)
MSETGKYVRRTAGDIQAMKTFYDGGRSFSEVGDEFGISPSRVEQLFRQHKIKTRRKTVSQKFLAAMQQRRIRLEREPLAELYLNEKLSIRRIAEKLGSTYDIVRSNLIAHRIPIRPLADHTTSRLTPDILRPLYIDQNLTAAQIAERLGYSVLTVRKRLFLFGIKKRSGGVAADAAGAVGAGSPLLPRSGQTAPEELKISATPPAMAETEALTIPEIAEKYRMHPQSIKKLVREGFFPHAERRVHNNIRRWVVPAADLENFVARGRGGVRIAAPTAATIQGRSVLAKKKIKETHNYRKPEIIEMMNLEKQGLTRSEIAVRFRLEEQIVHDLLEQCAVRPPRLRKKPRPAAGLTNLPEQRLIELYVESDISVVAIVRELNTNYAALYDNLKRYKIPLRNDRARAASVERETTLRRLVVRENLTIEEIAGQLGLSAAQIKRNLRDLKIRRRSATK